MPSLATTSDPSRSRVTGCESPRLVMAPRDLSHADGAGIPESGIQSRHSLVLTSQTRYNATGMLERS
jgi:hypothetical protein